MKRRSEIAPGVQFNSPRWMNNPLAIKLNPAVPVDSVAHLIPVVPDHRRFDPIQTPAEFKVPSRELRNLRRAKAWRPGSTREQQVMAMEEWFPDVQSRDSTTPDCEDPDVTMVDSTIDSPDAPSKITNDVPGCPSSNIGIFSKLPGEIRNRIYRLAVLEPDSKPVGIELQPRTCAVGACRHSKVSTNLPGIASTCRQMRWESAPIFLAENPGFTFDDGVVQQCCVNNYLRTLGPYLDLIHQFSFQLKRPIWNREQFIEYLTYTFTLHTPKDASDKFVLVQHEQHDRKICQCQLGDLVAKMNRSKAKEEMRLGKLVQQFVDSEGFSDFVWRTRKTKQWTSHLPMCKKCGEVYFNN